MAGDWIKMRVGLTTNPRVLRIAECLLDDGEYLEWSGLAYGVASYPAPSEKQNRSERHAALRVTRYVTVTALLRFWGYANEHAKGDFIAGVFREDVDEITGVPGFACAIEAAGWVDFDANGGLTMPNFNEHNTSADARSSGAERQARYREKRKEVGPRSDVTRDVTVTPREEKSREERKEDSQPPAGSQAPACPHAEIVALYHECLPACTKVKVWGEDRQAMLRKRWREDPKRQTLDYWRRLFAHCGKSDFLMGRASGRPFAFSLDWLIAPKNFAKVIEGKYHDRS